jgi:outer membrane protein assembly factor BamD
MKLLLPMLFLIAIADTGCSTIGTETTPEFKKDAVSNLASGNAALKSRNYTVAEQYFDFVRTKYPFLDASKEAELRLADTDFAREQYSGARDRYQNFAKLHPTHPRSDYAAYRAALTYYQEMPGDFFLVPRSYEKDQTAIRGALKSMAEFIKNYPSSSYLPEAQRMLNEVRNRLAKHELHVADFYAHHDRWPAVAARLESLVDNYPGAGYDQDALFRLHDVYQRLNQPERAKEALQKVIDRFPGTEAAERARKLQGS